MKNNLSKIQLFASIIFFAAFSVAFVFFYQKINDNNQNAEQNTINWQTEMKRRDDIRSLDRSLQKIANDRTSLDTHFAESSNVVPFLDTVEKLATKVGANAQVDSVNTEVNSAGLIVGLKASGTFESIYKFLTLLENSPYEIDFLSIDVHKSSTTETPGKNVRNLKWEAVFKIQLLSFVQ